MQYYERMISRQRKWMFYLLALLLLGAGLTPFLRIFLGLLLGTILSFYNLWLMQRKIDQLGKASTEQRTSQGIGTFTRLASAVLAVLVALQYPEYFHLISVVIGLMTAYLVIMIDFMLHKPKD